MSHSFIGTEHILLGLIHEGDGLAAKALASFDISLEAVRERVDETIGPSGSAPTGSPPFTRRAKKVLELALREALQLGHNYIGTEHILLGLVREGEGEAAQVLVSLGADLNRVRERVIELLSGYQGREGAARFTGGGTLPRPIRREHVVTSVVTPVGLELTLKVVRPGRRPDDHALAYSEIAVLLEGLGLDIDELHASDITVASIETTEGPGFEMTVRHRFEDTVEPEEI